MLHQIGNPDNCPAPNGYGSSKDFSYGTACKTLCLYIKDLCGLDNNLYYLVSISQRSKTPMKFRNLIIKYGIDAFYSTVE